MHLLQTSRLTKSVRGREIVSGINMQVKTGEIYGILGPNGAGKTTLMRMFTTLVKPTSGEIEIFGQNLASAPYDILKRMSSIIEFPVFYDKLTAIDNLELHCEYMGFYNKKAIHESLELVQLADVDTKPVREFSLGMKQRLGIARAITTRPELLILDEPINGLDPVGIREMRNLFYRLSKEYGMTLIISSHILGEMEQIADTICVVDKGKQIREVAMDEIRGMDTEYIEIQTSDRLKAVFVLEHHLKLPNFKLYGESMIRIYDLEIPQSELSRQLIMHDVPIESINRKKTVA